MRIIGNIVGKSLLTPKALMKSKKESGRSPDVKKGQRIQNLENLI